MDFRPSRPVDRWATVSDDWFRLTGRTRLKVPECTRGAHSRNDLGSPSRLQQLPLPFQPASGASNACVGDARRARAGRLATRSHGSAGRVRAPRRCLAATMRGAAPRAAVRVYGKPMWARPSPASRCTFAAVGQHPDYKDQAPRCRSPTIAALHSSPCLHHTCMPLPRVPALHE